ncbi:MAG TPA: cation:proton antiporter, partial [Thermoplasmata archaeon]|nr:cation:proton antiporter [Thermoplasmata archaeon]
MAELSGLMLQLGMVMLLAFLGAVIASRLRVSIIIGYIVAGMLIGPHIAFDFGGLSYRGLISDTSLIDVLSQIGLILLLFFVGLEFSVAKLRKVKEAAAVLAV